MLPNFFIEKKKKKLRVCWLIRRRTGVRISGQASKRNMKIIFPLIRFLAKTLTVNKPALKKFLKKSVVRSRR